MVDIFLDFFFKFAVAYLALLYKIAVMAYLNNKHWLSYSSGVWQSEIRMPIWSGFGESHWSSFADGCFLLCPYVAKKDKGTFTLGVCSTPIISWSHPPDLILL